MDENNGLFKYFDGLRYRFADPWSVHRQLTLASQGGINTLLEQAADKDNELRSLNAVGELVGIARLAFEMAAFDPETGGGATERHCLDALYAYCEYAEQKKTPGGSTPT